MSQDEIKVNIRTGTSERPPVYRHTYENTPIVIQLLLSHDDTLDEVLQHSMDIDSIKRNDDIHLEIPCHLYKHEYDDNCSICQKNFNQNDTVSTLECDHTFHYDCILEWGKYKQECPNCRTHIPYVISL